MRGADRGTCASVRTRGWACDCPCSSLTSSSASRRSVLRGSLEISWTRRGVTAPTSRRRLCRSKKRRAPRVFSDPGWPQEKLDCSRFVARTRSRRPGEAVVGPVPSESASQRPAASWTDCSARPNLTTTWWTSSVGHHYVFTVLQVDALGYRDRLRFDPFRFSFLLWRSKNSVPGS